MLETKRSGHRLGHRVAMLFVAIAAVAYGLPLAAQDADGLLLPPSFDAGFGQPTGAALAGVGTFPAPGWTTYALTEALIWGRDNQAVNRPLVESESGVPLLTAQDLQFPFGGGVRAFYGRRNPDDAGWEIGYFGLYGQSASRAVAFTSPDDYLQMPEPVGGILTSEGEDAFLKYNSLINSAEANLFRTATGWRDWSGGWLTVDWLVGFRYIGVEEQASITVDCCFEEDGSFIRVPYGVRSRSNLFGGQIGTRGRWDWQRWAVEGWAKAALMGSAQEQMQAPLVTFEGFELERLRGATGGTVGFVGDLNLSAVYRLNDVWGIRAGYSTVWITGVALAPDQFDFSLDEDAGGGLARNGGIFLHGANLGLEARW
jgi:hypothetical protein